MSSEQIKEKKGEHPWGDTGQLIALAIFVTVWLADSFWLNWTTFLSETIPNVIRLTIAIPLWILSGVIINYSHFVVDADRRPAGVVSTGAFRYVRHPVYLSSLLVYLGLVASSLSLVSLAFWLLIFLFYNRIAIYEERILIAKYGQVYIDYQRNTGRLFPKVTET